MSLGQTICRLRSQKGYSQSELADKLGVSRQSVSKWETDASAPDLENLVKLHELFGVTMDQLILGDASQQTTAPAAPVAPAGSAPVPVQAIAGTLLAVAGVLLLALSALQGKLAVGLILAVPFVVLALICFLVKRHCVLWCGWALYGLAYLFAVLCTRFSSSLFFWKFVLRWILEPAQSWQMYQTYWFDLFVAIVAWSIFTLLVVCTIRCFRSLRISSSRTRWGRWAAGCAVYLFLLPDWWWNGLFLPAMLALVRMALLTALLVYGTALCRALRE